MFLIQEGGTLKNVVIGPNQAEGVHCLGSSVSSAFHACREDEPDVVVFARILHPGSCVLRGRVQEFNSRVVCLT